MTSVQFEDLYYKSLKQKKDYIRKGQLLFNLLYYIKPTLADLIKSTKSDCFYNDEVINSTFSIIHIHWNEHAEEKKAMQEMRVGEVSMEQWDVSAVLE